MPEGWEIRTVTTLEEIEAIRPIWEEIQSREPFPVIDADIDRYLSVIGLTENNVQPYIIILSYKGNPTAMVIGKIQMQGVRLALGYKTFLNPKLKSLTVVYGGILGELNNDVCILLVRKLMEQLKSRKVNMVFFNHLKVDSHIYELSRSMPGILSRCYFPKHEKHWFISVPDNIEKFYQRLSTKHRGNLRRYKRKLEKEFADRLKTIVYSKVSDLDEAIKSASEVSRNTYQYGLGKGFNDDSTNRKFLEKAARKGWLRIHIMYIDGEPCAFENGIRYKNVYIGNCIGFNPKWRKWRIGTVLFLETLEQLCNDPQIDEIDFGFGDAEYKRNYGDKECNEASVYIFASRLYPLFINILRICFEALNSGLKYTVDKCGIISRVKRFWRNILENKNYENVYENN